jgi:hypothetical protein
MPGQRSREAAGWVAEQVKPARRVQLFDGLGKRRTQVLSAGRPSGYRFRGLMTLAEARYPATRVGGALARVPASWFVRAANFGSRMSCAFRQATPEVPLRSR